MKILANKKTQGFTLVEVLVAMVIFAIGMLGLAGMQGIALKDNNDAYMRSQAVFFAYDMGDRIRVNPIYWRGLVTENLGGAANLAADQVTVEGFGLYPFCSTDDSPADPPGGSLGGDPDPLNCNNRQLAQYDWYRIRKDITDALPNGALAITKIADPDGVLGEFIIRLVVSWDLTDTSDINKFNNLAPSFTFDVRP